MHPADLTWAQVDPAARTFDPDDVPAVVRSLPAAAAVPPRAPRWSATDMHRYHDATRKIDAWTDRVTAELVAQYGVWATGWRWSVGEGDGDGGVVRAWCCAAHSVTDADGTLEAVGRALVEWHDWLVELDERFSRFLPVPLGASPEVELDVFERAVAHLITVVVDRTFHESGWYTTATTVLGWFLSAAGIPADRHPSMIEDAVGGRFSSWVEPTPTVVADVAERLAGRIVRGA